MKYKVIIQKEAMDDFRDIHAYLKTRFGAKAAQRFKASFLEIIEIIKISPLIFEAVHDRKGMRKCAAMAPSIILYEVYEQAKRVEIRAVLDGRSDRKVF